MQCLFFIVYLVLYCKMSALYSDKLGSWPSHPNTEQYQMIYLCGFCKPRIRPSLTLVPNVALQVHIMCLLTTAV